VAVFALVLGAGHYALMPTPTVVSTAFVELLNTSDQPVNLANFALRISPTKPGLPWPESTYGADIPIPVATNLAPGARIAVPVPVEALSELSKDPLFEGVITLFDAQDQVVDRTDFMRWPVGSTLARPESDLGDFGFCQQVTPGAANTLCDIPCPLATWAIACVICVPPMILRHFPRVERPWQSRSLK